MRKSEQWQFRDQIVPAHIIHQLKKGTLSLTDLLLIFVIGPLVKPQGDGDGIGCYASNKYLASAANIAFDTYISKRLSFLKRKGIILIVRMNGRRYLELEWSRTAEERAELPGRYGRLLRKAYAKMVNRLGALGKPKGSSFGNTCEESSKQHIQEKPKYADNAGITLEYKPPLTLKCNHNNNDKSKEETSRTITSESGCNGFFFEKPHPYHELAIKLYMAVVNSSRAKRIGCVPNPTSEKPAEFYIKDWAKSLAKLERLKGHSREWIETVVLDHCENIDLEAPKQAEAFCGDSVYAKFPSLVGTRSGRIAKQGSNSGQLAYTVFYEKTGKDRWRSQHVTEAQFAEAVSKGWYYHDMYKGEYIKLTPNLKSMFFPRLERREGE